MTDKKIDQEKASFTVIETNRQTEVSTHIGSVSANTAEHARKLFLETSGWKENPERYVWVEPTGG
jgi:hypothetical protein